MQIAEACGNWMSVVVGSAPAASQFTSWQAYEDSKAHTEKVEGVVNLDATFRMYSFVRVRCRQSSTLMTTTKGRY